MWTVLTVLTALLQGFIVKHSSVDQITLMPADQPPSVLIILFGKQRTLCSYANDI